MNLTVAIVLITLALLTGGLLALRKAPRFVLEAMMGVVMWDFGMLVHEVIPPGAISTVTQSVFGAAMLVWWGLAVVDWRRGHRRLMSERTT